MTKPGALDEAMEGCAGVVHVASESSFSPDPNKVITPSVAFTKNILNSAAKASSVKRFVYTSSQATLPPLKEPGVIRGTSWRSDADGLIAHAWAEPYTPDKSPIVYVASKICAERACWEFVEQEKPGFVLNSVVSGFNIGDVIHPQLISSSNGVVLGMMKSNPFAVGFIKGISQTNFVNVEDNALLHLAALTMDDTQGQRLLALGEAFDLNRMVDVLESLAPDSNLPPKVDNLGAAMAEVDTTREAELLKTLGKKGFAGFDESVHQCLTTATGGN